jgi:ABC-type multidrug transport system fused ATPase/permease subunit
MSLTTLISLVNELWTLVLPSEPLRRTTTTRNITNSITNSANLLYELQPVIEGLSVSFCRYVVVTGSLTTTASKTRAHSTQSSIVMTRDNSQHGINQHWEWIFRTFISLLLGSMAYYNIGYDYIYALHLWSHALPAVLTFFNTSAAAASLKTREGNIKKKLASRHGTKVEDNEEEDDSPSLLLSLIISIIIFISVPSCLFVTRWIMNYDGYSILPSILTNTGGTGGIMMIMPQYIIDIIYYSLPIKEITASYNILQTFFVNDSDGGIGGRQELQNMLTHLLFVTFHVQMGMGHVGIAFLMKEQDRKNMLVRMDVDDDDDVDNLGDNQSNMNNKVGKTNNDTTKQKKIKDASYNFRRTAPTFIFYAVLPYMFQIIFFGNINKYAYIQVRDNIHRTVRIRELFVHDGHLTAMAGSGQQLGPSNYAEAATTIVANVYEICNRKLFSLPKLLILPSVISRQPQLLVSIFPFIIISDMIKGRFVSIITDRVEKYKMEYKTLGAKRTKVEQYDLKNAELLRRSGAGATSYTQYKWDELTMEHQAKSATVDLLERTRSYFQWLQRNFVFVALIDCALARLLADGTIIIGEIFVFSRAIEDVVDLLLIRSRSESELATLMSEVERLTSLNIIWNKSKEPRLVHCHIHGSTTTMATTDNGGGGSSDIVLKNVQYSRGTASVFVKDLVIGPGIYAVTGANGSGKSTLFRVLMACDTSSRPIDLHESIEVANNQTRTLGEGSCLDTAESSCMANNEEVDIGSLALPMITMPSSDIVEISQNFYWPLYSRPIDWICQEYNDMEACTIRVVQELQSLSFRSQEDDTTTATTKTNQGDDEKSDDAAAVQTMELLEEKEDWFSQLSGGQKSKVELVRTVFLRKECPSVLLGK